MEAFKRTKLLIGQDGLDILKQSSVLIVGLGGVGSYATEAIVRCGVGNITIVDYDYIQQSNLNRQIPALTSTVGKLKTEVMANRILDINPFVNLKVINDSYNEKTSKDILTRYDYTIDAIDSLPDKIHLIKTCINKNQPIVSSMGMANRLDPLKLKVEDISKTSCCPMARKIRKELRILGVEKGLKVVFSEEIPEKLKEEDSDTKLGSISFVPSTAGLILASVAINNILANGEL
ncbi:HesA/MoeB/ThiF family protein [Candidatus Syntrophocurvum alkaliphilum]|uniref:HesA/MoeB/ThiF family protein n=1 Tax=Candidatus Syntrophocurvum alkaliphilum TaxID=2293317 RepID=A0A6I6DFB0_9FIRM|nr:tRNA threonylcarbamoyladenosine dehydratase [Candidatus Syntrophocurvum alkaliphilum]QGT99121.1 HesA/MoeB/ThiF family protein [Candidatus Syntrophocurvum alkaliphilum]